MYKSIPFRIQAVFNLNFVQVLYNLFIFCTYLGMWFTFFLHSLSYDLHNLCIQNRYKVSILYTFCIAFVQNFGKGHSLSTGSCILSQTFHWAKSNRIRLDNGTYFIGTSAGLLSALQEMDHKKIANFLKENGGDWMVCKSEIHHMQVIWEEFGSAK